MIASRRRGSEKAWGRHGCEQGPELGATLQFTVQAEKEELLRVSAVHNGKACSFHCPCGWSCAEARTAHLLPPRVLVDCVPDVASSSPAAPVASHREKTLIVSLICASSREPLPGNSTNQHGAWVYPASLQLPVPMRLCVAGHAPLPRIGTRAVKL